MRINVSELMFGRALRCNIVKLNCFDYSSSVFGKVYDIFAKYLGWMNFKENGVGTRANRET